MLVVTQQAFAVLDRPGLDTRPEEHVLVQEFNEVAFGPSRIELRICEEQGPLILKDNHLAVDIDRESMRATRSQETRLARASYQVSGGMQSPRAGQMTEVWSLRDVVREGSNLDKPLDECHASGSAV